MPSLDDAVLDELRRMNRLLAYVAIRGTEDGEAMQLLARAGYSQSQIAEMLGVTANAVQKRLKRDSKKKQQQKVSRTAAAAATEPPDEDATNGS